MALALLRPARALCLLGVSTTSGLVLGLLLGCFRVVPAGYVGVVEVFGDVRNRTLSSGLHAVHPFARLVRIPTDMYEWHETLTLTAAHAEELQLTATVHARILPDRAHWLQVTIGDRPWSYVVLPALRTACQEAAGYYEADELVGESRDRFVSQVRAHLEAVLREAGLEVRGLSITDVSPTGVGTGTPAADTPL